MRIFLKPLFIVLLTLTSLCASGQENLLNITIVNAENGEPVSYATISFPDRQYGFSANGNGFFRLPYHATDMDQKIVISSIGYERYQSTIGQLVESQTTTIQLQPAVTVLQEILIKAQQENPVDIVANCEKNLGEFLGKDPYYLYGFYREELRQNGRYAGYTDAYGLFYVSGYHPSYNRKNELFAYDLAQWKNVRRSLYHLPPVCADREERLLGIDQLAKAKAAYLYDGPLSRKNQDLFRYTIDSLTVYDDNDVFVIGFRPLEKDHEYYGRLYIKADDYALLKMQVIQPDATELLHDSCEKQQVAATFDLSFTKVDNRYYPDVVKLQSRYSLNGRKIEEIMTIRGGEFRENNVAGLNQEQRVIIYNEMLNPVVVFEEGFWQSNKVRIPDQADRDLGEKIPLQEQFFANNGNRIIPLPKNYTSYEEMSRDTEVFRMFLEGDF